jgi:hypothetical protein
VRTTAATSAASSRCLSSKFGVERYIPVVSSRRCNAVEGETAHDAWWEIALHQR